MAQSHPPLPLYPLWAGDRDVGVEGGRQQPVPRATWGTHTSTLLCPTIITENLYIVTMGLLKEQSLEEVRYHLHKEVDCICDAIEYGENDEEVTT